MRDRTSGEPTGVFKEAAKQLLDLEGESVARKEEEEEARRLRSWQAAFDLAASLGVTTVQLVGSDAAIYEEFRNAGKLTLRVYLNGRLPDKESELHEYVRLSKRYPRSDNWIRFGFLKGFADGTLSSTTALLFKPFSDEPDNRVCRRCLTRNWNEGSWRPTGWACRSGSTGSETGRITGY